MNTAALLTKVEAAGVRLTLVGYGLGVQARPSVRITPDREQITTSKPILVALLRLQDEIVRAAPAAGDAFDRQYCDELWRQWHVLQEQDTVNL